MIWYVATLTKVVLVEAPSYGQAKIRGKAELQQRFYKGKRPVVVTCRQATKDDISLHLLYSSVQIAAVAR